MCQSHQFNDAVINWSFEHIQNPMPKSNKSIIKSTFNDPMEHHQAFVPMIFEESRAILEQGLEKYTNNPNSKDKMDFEFKFCSSKKQHHKLNFKCDKLTKVVAGEAVLVCNQDLNAFVIGLAGFSADQKSVSLSISERNYNICKPGFKDKQIWAAYKLGTLIPLRRMFEACSMQTLCPFDKSLALGTVVNLGEIFRDGSNFK